MEDVKKTELTENQTVTNPTPSEDVTPWITWTQLFVIADGVAHSIRTLVATDKLPLPDAVKTGFLATLSGLHVALKDVDNAFIAAIDSIKKGQTPDVVIDAAPIPDWDDDLGNPTLELLKSGWEVVKPSILLAIEQLQGKDTPEMEKIIIALGALANASDDIIKAVAEVLGE